MPVNFVYMLFDHNILFCQELRNSINEILNSYYNAWKKGMCELLMAKQIISENNIVREKNVNQIKWLKKVSIHVVRTSIDTTAYIHS